MACRMLWIGALLVIDCIDKSSQPKCIMNVREIKLSKLSIGWRELGAQLLPTECLRWHFTHKYDVAVCVCDGVCYFILHCHALLKLCGELIYH